MAFPFVELVPELPLVPVPAPVPELVPGHVPGHVPVPELAWRPGLGLDDELEQQPEHASYVAVAVAGHSGVGRRGASVVVVA